jgi:uncharacterized membrane protein
MTSNKKIIFSAALVGLLAVSCQSTNSTAKSEAAEGKCFGVNACKGHGDCASKVDACNGKDGCSAKSSCKGQNACKGKGFNKMSKKSCEAKGGKFES